MFVFGHIQIVIFQVSIYFFVDIFSDRQIGGKEGRRIIVTFSSLRIIIGEFSLIVITG